MKPDKHPLKDNPMTDAITFVKFINEQLGIPLRLAEEIVTHFEYNRLSKNEFLLRSGAICDKYMFIHTGFMRAVMIDPEGREITTNFYSRCQQAFEPASFFNRSVAQESLQAITDCSGWIADFKNMDAYFHTHAGYREFGRRLLVRSIVDLKERLILSQTETAQNRYLLLLKQHPDLINNVPLKYIASYLGITDSSLSRIRNFTAKNKL